MSKPILCPHGIVGKWSCQDCVRKYQREYAKENRDKKRKIEQRYRDNHREQIREKSRRQKATYRKRHLKRIQEYREKNKKKTSAQNLLNHHPEKYPLASECELCPEDKRVENLQHHHPDYDYPEIYVTVCPFCHYYADKYISKSKPA